MSSLPPPIRGPSGKIFVAIPAPSFIFMQDTLVQYPNANDAPSYVYVEYSPNGPHPMPPGLPPDQTTPIELKSSVSINTWMNSNCVSEPPPGHIPWTGEVSPDSSSGSESTCAEDVLHATKSSMGCAIFSNSSMSSFEIPSIPTCDTLLDGFLPSTCSSAWSGGLVPPSISTAKSGGKCTALVAPAERKPHSTSKHHKTPDNRRYTICITSSMRHREARVFNQHRTSVKAGSLRSSNEEDRSLPHEKMMISQIDELDFFFSEGLKKMDRTMLRLTEEQNKVKPPSLVVSTSSNIRPISLESSSDDSTSTSKTGSPTLAKRRGKNTPGPLKLENCTGLKPALEYPDVPTAFRGSPEPTLDSRFDELKYPALKLDTNMTTDQMICSLREQVESFYPQPDNSERKSDAFMSQCKEAEMWLQDELVQSPYKSEANPNSDKDQIGAHAALSRNLSRLAHFFLDDESQIRNTARVQAPQVAQPDPVQSLHANMARMSAEESTTAYAAVRTPKTKPRKSILSNGPGSSCSSTKKVRFSEGLPTVILPVKHATHMTSVHAVATKRATLTSPKRKPVPPIVSIKSPTEMRNSLPATPTKPSSMRKSSPLNPTSRVTVSTSLPRPPLKRSEELARSPLDEKTTATKVRISSPFKKGPFVFSSASNVSAPEAMVQDSPLAKKSARPLSVGANLKENRERSFSIATIAKRRSFAAMRNDADKENQQDSKIADLVAREAQKKSGRRSLPFQNMLSRLRG